MKRWLLKTLGIVALAMLANAPALAADTVYYYYTDTLHSAAVITDASGNVVERTYYAPYGQVLNRPLRDGPAYTGQYEDPMTGLDYMQQRYYDPQSGRFVSIDPVGVGAEGGNFNRYWYAEDNPYRYTDPDGRDVTEFLGGLIVETAHLVTGQGFNGSAVVGALIDGYNGQGPGIRGALEQDAGIAAIVVSGGADAPEVAGAEEAADLADEGGTEIVQRAMSREEAQSIQDTGKMSRGGRDGPFHVSDSVNSTAKRARQRLALDHTPEVRATLKVRKGVFSKSSKVEEQFKMLGGGTERTAPGGKDIPVKLIRIDEMKP